MSEVEVCNLSKSFGGIEALKNISFCVNKGETFALLGPNGAGKTTAIKIMTGLILNYQGKVLYRGRPFSPYDSKIKGMIGVVPQYNNLDKELTVYQNLKLHALLFGLSGRRLKYKIEEVLDIAGMRDHKNRKADHLSGGMKRRLVVARALLHDPEILYLDEPTIGLDPAVRRTLWDFIVRLKSEGKTVILTTHYIEEADMLSDRVLIMDKGKVVAEGAPHVLKSSLGKFVLEIHYPEGIKEEFFNSKEEAMGRAKFINFPVRIREVTLEDVFLKYTGRRIEV